MKKLSTKEQKFAELCVSLGNQTEAYRQSHNPTDKDAEWLRINASKLANQTNIALTIKELKEDLQESRKVTRETIRDLHYEIIDWYKELKQLARRTDLTKDDKARVYMLKDLIKGSDFRGSVDSITKMYGLNEPDKAEVKVERVEVTIKRSKK